MRLLILALMLFTNHSLAQVKGFISFGGDWNSGNYDAVGLTLKSEIKKDTGLYQWNVSPNYRWSEQSPVGGGSLNLYENELYLTANLSKEIVNRTRLIGFTENEKSYLRKINFRSAGGLGLSYEIVKAKGLQISLSELVLPEYYWSSSNTEWNNFTIRLSSRLKIEYSKNNLKLSSVSLFQPSVLSSRVVGFADNLNIRSTTTSSLKLSNHYEVGLLHNLIYQGYPYFINKAVKPLQQTASLFIKYSF